MIFFVGCFFLSTFFDLLCFSTFFLPSRPRPPTNTTQLELKEYLTKIYGFDIATLRTSVLAGKKKRGKAGNSYARPDIKKVYVTLKPPSTPSSSQ